MSARPRAAAGAMKRAVVPDDRASSSAPSTGNEPRLPGTCTRAAVTVDPEADPEVGETAQHRLGVLGEQDAVEHRSSPGQRGTDQGAVGDALGSGRPTRSASTGPVEREDRAGVSGHRPAQLVDGRVAAASR